MGHRLQWCGWYRDELVACLQLAGIYNVCVHIEYTTTCFKDTMFIVEVLAPLVAAFTSGDTTVCFSPLPLSFLNESSGLGVLSYSWLVNSVQQATTTDFIDLQRDKHGGTGGFQHHGLYRLRSRVDHHRST
ncbi:MAG: hypothetical protein IPI07_17070 [Flavobacteriales bacterium]|nr:hypothetical protein [Flavobacteriales bacterium]